MQDGYGGYGGFSCRYAWPRTSVGDPLHFDADLDSQILTNGSGPGSTVTLKMLKNKFFHIFSYNLPAGVFIFSLKIEFFATILY